MNRPAFVRGDERTSADDGDAFHFCSTCAFSQACLEQGMEWLHLRICLSCGHVGCCDQSPGRHTTKHWQESGHPVVQSFEPDEDWRWCYADEVYL